MNIGDEILVTINGVEGRKAIISELLDIVGDQQMIEVVGDFGTVTIWVDEDGNQII